VAQSDSTDEEGLHNWRLASVLVLQDLSCSGPEKPVLPVGSIWDWLRSQLNAAHNKGASRALITKRWAKRSEEREGGGK
jgi:hypothetical protein